MDGMTCRKNALCVCSEHLLCKHIVATTPSPSMWGPDRHPLYSEATRGADHRLAAATRTFPAEFGGQLPALLPETVVL